MFPKKKYINFENREALQPPQNTSSHLASIFDDPPGSEKSSGRSTLHYVPPKQPKPGTEILSASSSRSSTPSIQQAASTDTNPVLLAVKVDLSRVTDVDDHIDRVGIAVSCILAPNKKFSPSTWLLYQNSKHPLAKLLIDDSLSLSVISNDRLQIHGTNSGPQWLLKTTPEQLVALLLQVYACKAVAGSSAVTTELLSPAPAGSSALQALDWTEVRIKTLEISATGRVKQVSGGEGERMRVCVSSPHAEGSPEWTAHLLGAKKTERRLVICKEGDVLRGYDVTIEKIKRRKPRSSCSTPAPPQGVAVPPQEGGLLTAPPSADAPASGDAGQAAQQQQLVAGAVGGDEVVAEETPATKASVLSRIARMGQPVFGMRTTASGTTGGVTAAPEQVVAAPLASHDLIASSADHELAKASRSTSNADLSQAHTELVSAEACGPLENVRSSSQTCVVNPAAEVDAPNCERVISNNHRSPNSFQPILSATIGSECCKNDLKINNASPTMMASEKTNVPHRETSMSSLNTFTSTNQQAAQHSTGLLQPVPFSTSAAQQSLPNSDAGYGLHPPISGAMLSSASFHSPSAPHHASPGTALSTPYNSTPYHFAAPHFNLYNWPHQSAVLHHNLAPYPPPHGPAAQTEVPLSLLLSESRSQNTELRIAVARMADQVADVQNKMQEVLSTKNTASEVELLDTLSSRVNSRISDMFAAQQLKDVSASENLAVVRHQVTLLRRALVAHCPELERAAGDATPVSRVSSDVISWAEDSSREADFMDKMIELASAGKLVYCKNWQQSVNAPDLTSLAVSPNEIEPPVVLAEEHNRTVAELEEVSRKYSAACAALESAKVYENKFHQLQQALGSSGQFDKDLCLSASVHSTVETIGKLTTNEKSEPQKFHSSSNTTGEQSNAHSKTVDSPLNDKTMEAEKSASDLVGVDSKISLEQKLSDLNAISDELLKLLESYDVDVLKSLSSSEEVAPLNTLTEKLRSIAVGSAPLVPVVSESDGEHVGGSFKTHLEEECVAELKEDNKNLRKLLKEKEDSIHNLEALMSQELKLKDEALEEMNVSKIGVEAELLELSAAQQSMEGDLRLLRQQTVNLRQIADKYKSRCREPEHNPNLPNGDISYVQICGTENEEISKDTPFHGGSMPKKMHSISTQTDSSNASEEKAVLLFTCDASTETISTDGDGQTGASPFVGIFSNGVSTQTIPTVVESAGATTQTIPTVVESVGATTQTIPTVVESAGATTQTIPTVVESAGATTQTIPATVENSGAATQTYLTGTVQPLSDVSTQTASEPTVLQETSSELQYSAEDLEESVSSGMKKAMNAVYKSAKELFLVDKQYEGKEIRRLIQSVIRETTLQFLAVFAQQLDERREHRQMQHREQLELQQRRLEAQEQLNERTLREQHGEQREQQDLQGAQRQLPQLQSPQPNELLNGNSPGCTRPPNVDVSSEESLAHQKGPFTTDHRSQPLLTECVHEEEKSLKTQENSGSSNGNVYGIERKIEQKTEKLCARNEQDIETEMCGDKYPLNFKAQDSEEGNKEDNDHHLSREDHHNLTGDSSPGSDTSLVQEQSLENEEREECEDLSHKRNGHSDEDVDIRESEVDSSIQKFAAISNKDSNLLGQLKIVNDPGDRQTTDDSERVSEDIQCLPVDEKQVGNFSSQEKSDQQGVNEEKNKSEAHEQNEPYGIEEEQKNGDQLINEEQKNGDQLIDGEQKNGDQLIDGEQKNGDQPIDEEQKNSDQLIDDQKGVLVTEQQEVDCRGAEGQHEFQENEGIEEPAHKLEESRDVSRSQELDNSFHENQEKFDSCQDFSSRNDSVQSHKSSELYDLTDDLPENEEPHTCGSEERSDNEHSNQEPNEALHECEQARNSEVDQVQTLLLNQPDDVDTAPRGGVFSSTPAPDAPSARATEVRSYSSQPPPMPLFSSDEDDDWYS